MWTEDEVSKTLLEWRISTQTKPKYTIIANVESEIYGQVMGSGTFDENSQTTLVAMPKDGYEFVKWSDGDTNYGRTINVKEDLSITAIFRKKEPENRTVPYKRETAKIKVQRIKDVNTAKAMLVRIVEEANDHIINLINNM